MTRQSYVVVAVLAVLAVALVTASFWSGVACLLLNFALVPALWFGLPTMFTRLLIRRWPWYGSALILALLATEIALASSPFLLMYGVIGWVAAGVPAAIVTIGLLVTATRRGESVGPPLVVLGVILGCACFLGVAVPLNHLVQKRAVAAAKEYPPRVAQLLESYRETHGIYPKSLNDLPSHPRLPRLLRYGDYHSNGKSYSFWFPDPTTLGDHWNYSSERPEWLPTG
jgi:hypothetical protein